MKQETYNKIKEILEQDDTILQRTKRAVLKDLTCADLPTVKIITYQQALRILKCSRQNFTTYCDKGYIHALADNKYMKDEILAFRKQQIKKQNEIEAIGKKSVHFAIDWTIPYELIYHRKTLGISHIDVFILAKVASDNLANALFDKNGDLQGITKPYELNARNLGRELGVHARTINRRVRVLIEKGYLHDIESHSKTTVNNYHIYMLQAFKLYEKDTVCRVIDSVVANKELTPCEKLYLLVIADHEEMSYRTITGSCLFNYDSICLLTRTGYLKNIDGKYFVNYDKFTKM